MHPDPAARQFGEEAQQDGLAHENHLLRKLVTMYGYLSSLAAHSDIEPVTELIAERTDATVAVVNQQMDVLAAAAAGQSAATAADRIHEQVVHPRLVHVLSTTSQSRRALRLPEIQQDPPLTVAPVLVRDEVPAYLIRLEHAKQAFDDDFNLLVTEHAATIIGVILGRERVVAASKVRDDLVEGLLSAREGDSAEVLRWAKHLSYDAQREHVVLSIGLESDSGQDAESQAADMVEHFFTTQVPDAITSVRGLEVVVMLPSSDEDTTAVRAARLAELCLKRLREVFRADVVTVGIGRPCQRPTDIARSYAEACRTISAARRMGRRGHALAFEDLGILRLLAQVTDVTELRAFGRDVLGTLWAAESSSAVEYRHTLACYFQENNSPQRAARMVHVHPNTVTYRIHRAEEITGLDLTRYQDRLTAQVALEILDAVGTEQSELAAPLEEGSDE